MRKSQIEQRYLDLAEKWVDGSISAAEMQEYAAWLEHLDDEVLEVPSSIASTRYEHKQKILRQLRRRMNAQERRYGRVVSPAAARIVAAAAIVGFCFFLMYKFTGSPAASQNQQSIVVEANDIPAGSNGAILTLANGQVVVLDTTANGTISNSVLKNNNVLVFNKADSDGSEVAYNTLVTPRAHQQKLILPDGSEVWLNAESSIKFPTAFKGDNRIIDITGEAYFEIKEDKTKPFVVRVSGSSITVLGTHFNVMAYSNEPALETTLLEGSVRFNSPEKKEQLLKPGQQVRLTTHRQMQLVQRPDIDAVMAWKNGLQSFRATDIQVLLRQIERWYNVDVETTSEIPSGITFSGEVPREVTLSELLKALETKQLSFQLDASRRKLTLTYTP